MQTQKHHKNETTNKHLSDKLLDDLVEKGILRINHNRKDAQRLIRHYFCSVFKQAVLDTNCARNKPQYVEPIFTDL